MIKVSYAHEHNTVIIEFIDRVDVAQAEQSYLDIQKIVPTCGKGFKILTDFTLLDRMAFEVQGIIKKSMDFFNQHGVTEILRVIPDPEQDFGFNILSPFHYSKEVKFLTLQSREEAQARLRNEKQNA